LVHCINVILEGLGRKGAIVCSVAFNLHSGGIFRPLFWPLLEVLLHFRGVASAQRLLMPSKDYGQAVVYS
jgi:hypothetical protein